MKKLAAQSSNSSASASGRRGARREAGTRCRSSILLLGASLAIMTSRARAETTAVDEPTVTAPLVVTQAAPMMMATAGAPASLDKTYGLKGWNTSFPSFGDTILGDAGGFRSALADKGIGFLAYDINLFAANTLGNPQTNRGRQAYWGQSPSDCNIFNVYVTYDLGKIGIPNGQFQVAGSIIRSTWNPYFPNAYSFYRLAYYQSLFNGKLEFNVGYMGNSFTFVGIYVGGQLQSPFGPSASIPVELGLGSGSATQPTAWASYHFVGHFYDKVGIARSISPTSSPLVNENAANPSGLNFAEAGARAVYVNEVGYQHRPTPGTSSSWVRLGGIYNTSPYHDYAARRTSDNYGFYFLADQQVWQADPSVKGRSGRGLYAGMSLMYAAPETSIFTQYFEGRLYALGPFKSRPKDTISLVYNHQTISKYFSAGINQTSFRTGTFAQTATDSITGSYTVNVGKGLYVTAGLGYTDNPSATYIAKEGSALNFLGSLFASF